MTSSGVVELCTAEIFLKLMMAPCWCTIPRKVESLFETF